MALLVLAPAAAVARIIAPEFGFAPPVGLCCDVLMVMVMVAIRAMHMGFLRFAFRLIHSANRYKCQ